MVFLMQKYIFIKIDSFQLILLICKLKIKSKGTFSYKVPIEDYCSKIPDLSKTTSQSSNKYSTVCKNNEKIYSSDIKAKNVIKKVSSNIKKCQATCN